MRKLIVNDGHAQRELLLAANMVIGRDPTCDVSDSGPLLSRRHAEFVVTPAGVKIRDLNSRNGILVNGAKVMEGVLRAGDVVQVGHLQLRYVEEAVVAEAAEAEGADATIVLAPPRPAAAAKAAMQSAEAAPSTTDD